MTSARKLNPFQPRQIQLEADSQERGDTRSIGVGDSLAADQLLRFATDLGFSHICQKKGLEFDKEMFATKNLIVSPESYFSFPASSILAPTNQGSASERALLISDQTFTSSSEKRPCLENLIRSMDAKGLPRTMIDDVIAVADELFTNAIFNAPFVDQATYANPGVSRHNLEIQLESGKQGRLFLALDESRLVIGCEDPFGSLSIGRYLSKVRATYHHGAAATMNFGPGGAGLGSYIIFNTGSSLYMGVWPGHSTVVCCVLPLGMSNRRRTMMPKHLHWIQR